MERHHYSTLSREQRKRPGSRPRGAWLHLIALLSVSACTAELQEPDEAVGTSAWPVVVCAEDEQIEGIDVSYYQGSIDWDDVADDDIYYGITRVNHGGFMDPQFDPNWAAMKERGILRGAYQYFDAGDDPVEQADILIDKVGLLGPGDLPAVIDIEATDGQNAATIAANVQTWIDLVEEGTGRQPIIYTGSYFWNDNVASTAMNDHPLWIAHYTQNCPNLPTAWSNWALWQYTSSGSVDGISGNVDRNRFNGTLEELHDFAANGYRAQLISIDYPDSLVAGETASVQLVLKNLGARSWTANTQLGTTMPRDRQSGFVGAAWLNEGRVLAFDDEVATGEEVSLSFEITAPAELGEHSEHFNLVENEVAWFSDTPPGGGPLDDVIVLHITVNEGSSGAGVGGSAGSTVGAGGNNSNPMGIPNRGVHQGGCSILRPEPRSGNWPWGLLLLGGTLARRRQQTRRRA